MALPVVRRVVVADDDQSIRRMVSMLLRLRGFQPVEARDGSEALAAMRGGNIDLVILDLMMPVVSGSDLLRERAGDPLLLRIPVILVTAINRAEMPRGVRDGHVCAVVTKPFDLDDLMEKVTGCLAGPGAVTPAAT